MGSLAIHIAAKLPVTQRALTRPLADGDGRAGAVRRRPERSHPARVPVRRGRRRGRRGRAERRPDRPAAALDRHPVRAPARRRPAGPADQPDQRGRRAWARSAHGGRLGARADRPQRHADADPGRSCSRCRGTRPTCRSPASRDGAPARPGAACGSATWCVAAGGDHTSSVARRLPGAVRDLPAHPAATGVRQPPGHVAGAGHQGGAAASRARLPGPDHRSQPARASCRPSGSPRSPCRRRRGR